MSAPAVPTFDEFSRKQANVPDFDEWSKPGGQSVPIGDRPVSMASFTEVPSVMAGQAGRAIGTAASDIYNAPLALSTSLRHPFNTVKNAFGATENAVGRTENALGKGQYGEAAKSAIGAIPVVGPGMESVTRDATEGRIPEAVGHIGAAYLTSKVPAMIRSAPRAISTVQAVAPAVVRGGWEGATAPSTFRIRGTPVQVPVPASVAGAGLGYEIGKHIPFVNPEVGGAVGGAVGAAAPAIRGAYRGGMAAWKNRPQPLGPQQSLFGKPSIFNMPGAPDTSGPTGNTPKTPRQIGAAPPEPLPTSRQVESGATRIVTPPPADTSGVIPGWKPTVLPNEKAATPPVSISSPKPQPASIQVPAQGAADVVERVEHPPFAQDRSFPASQKIREQTPAPATPDIDAQVDRLRKAFPWESDQQLRARAGHSNVMSRISSTPGALEKMQQLRKSLGGK